MTEIPSTTGTIVLGLDFNDNVTMDDVKVDDDQSTKSITNKPSTTTLSSQVCKKNNNHSFIIFQNFPIFCFYDNIGFFFFEISFVVRPSVMALLRTSVVPNIKCHGSSANLCCFFYHI